MNMKIFAPEAKKMINENKTTKRVRFIDECKSNTDKSDYLLTDSSDNSELVSEMCCEFSGIFLNDNLKTGNDDISRENKNGYENVTVMKTERNNSKHFDGYFKGFSKRLHVFFLVWIIVNNLGFVSAAPNIFDFDFFGRTYDAFSCGCAGGGSKRARVVGGAELPEGSAPWLVALTKGGRSHCGSTLISQDHLLTAAHCIDGISVDELVAWLGIYSISQAMANTRGIRIRRAYQHPDFHRNGFHNDIAVLKLAETVTFSDTVRPICLPTKDNTDYGSRTALVAGWGKTAENEPPSDIPRQAYVQVWPQSKCRNSGYPAKRVSGAVLCAGLSKGGVDACQGDSGGPLIMEASHGGMEIIGVVSWGRGCARPNLPGVYTRVASFLPFIHDIIDNSCD